MKQYLYIWIATFIGAFVPTILWLTFNAFILGNCDAKFGCIGGVQIAMLFHCIGGFVSAIIVTGTFILFKDKFGLIVSKSIIISSTSIGIVLGLFIPILLAYNLVIPWLFISFLLSSIVFYIQKI